MLRAYPISLFALFFLWSVFSSWGELSVYDDIVFLNDEVAIDLSDSIHPIEVLEYSDSLSDWIPVSRNYGYGWETIFPFTYSLGSGVLSIPNSEDKNGNGILDEGEDIGYLYGPSEAAGNGTLDSSDIGFFRKRYQSTLPSTNHNQLASRFLRQATFGPKLSDILDFPSLPNSNFPDFESWIDQQVLIEPFYHRAYFRQRSDPDFINKYGQSIPGLTIRGVSPKALINEVEHDPDLGIRIPFYRNNAKISCDWNSIIPGYGGRDENYIPLTSEALRIYSEDKNGNSILDEGEDIGYLYGPPEAAGNGILDSKNIEYDYNGIPKVGFHVEKAISLGKTIWDLQLGFTKEKQVVWYEAAINGNDQLRQRIAWAMSQYFVVGELGSNQLSYPERWTNYYDIFVRNAFGNFRDILSEVTWNPLMGHYLSYVKNKKEDTSAGTFPDENFAREVMQLFTIGLLELNQDGTLEKDDLNNPIATYNNDDIREFAKVFTGLIKQEKRSNIEISFANDIDPLRVQSTWHDMSGKKLLDGTTLGPFSGKGNVSYNNKYDIWENFEDVNGNGNYDIGESFTDTGYNDPELFLDSNGNGVYDIGESFSDFNANGTYDIKPFNSGSPSDSEAVVIDIEGLLDHLFFHKNMPPFFARFMIQRFTVSTPSPNYIKSVANAFSSGLYNGVGSGQRGDMLATIKAVLLHPEARETSLSEDYTYGKLREPLIRIMNLCRAFKLDSLRVYDWILFNNMTKLINQEPYKSPSVFNFYQSDFSPVGEIGNIGHNAPEFQISNDTTLISIYNIYHTLIYHGIIGGDSLYGGKGGQIGSKNFKEAELDFEYETSLAYDINGLINHLDILLTAGSLSEEVKAIIYNSLNQSSLSGEDLVKLGIYLIVSTNEFNILF